MVALFVMLTIILFLTIDYFVQFTQARGAEVSTAASAEAPVVPVKAHAYVDDDLLDIQKVPSGVYMAKGHTWVRPESSRTVSIGVDGLPIKAIGSPDDICLLPGGTEVCKGGPLLKLGRGEKRITLRSPIDGVIKEVNHEVINNLSKIKSDPFGSGWLYRITPRNLMVSIQEMYEGNSAVTWLKRELERLREFLNSHSPVPAVAGATMLDGGEPVEGFIGNLGDDQWSCFVHKFISSESGTECDACARLEADKKSNL